MATIRCKGCGALYNYDKEGCCPKCGAYNRPPARERVNADGTVRHMDDASFARHGGGSGKVCFEKKKCYERKECHEQDARQYRAVQAAHRAGAAASFAKAEKSAARKKKTPSLGVVVLIVILVISAGKVINMRREAWEKTGMETISQQAWYASLEADVSGSVGKTVLLHDGTTLRVESVEWDDNDANYIYLISTERTYPDGLTDDEIQKAEEGILSAELFCRSAKPIRLSCIDSGGGAYLFASDDYMLPDHVVFCYESPLDGSQQIICVWGLDKE